MIFMRVQALLRMKIHETRRKGSDITKTMPCNLLRISDEHVLWIQLPLSRVKASVDVSVCAYWN
ncbi:hypothetical protein NMG60_11026615 [Bertholletia excelsa]